MRIRVFLTAIVIACGLLLLSRSPAAAHDPVSPLFAVLLGGNEVSAANEANAGDQNGIGSATVLIRGTTLCFAVIVNGIATPTLTHIHQGAAGINGPILVDLVPPSTGNPGTSSGCIPDVNARLLDDIRSNPKGFYVNVHNAAFPSGAVRGQLF
jgi:hypothetical protein